MNNIEHFFAKVPLTKVSRWPFFFCCLIATGTLAYRVVSRIPHQWDTPLYFLAAISILLIYLAALLLKVVITTNAVGINIRGNTMDRFIRWQKIRRCVITKNKILLYPAATILPITLDLKLINEKERFIAILKDQLENRKDEALC